jgi:hypothetical protein
MRFYSVVRFGTYKIRYAEVGRTLWDRLTPQEQFKKNVNELLTIPSSTPKQFDPFLLWKQTEWREPFHILEIQDKAGHTWFEIKSTEPLSKILEIPSDALKEMQ